MGKGERKLTEKELQRKERLEKLCAEMEQNGYVVKVQTIGVVKANIFALFVMLPFALLALWLYDMGGGSVSFSDASVMLFLPVILVLVVMHELIHGLMFGIFAKEHFKSVEFGVI